MRLIDRREPEGKSVAGMGLAEKTLKGGVEKAILSRRAGWVVRSPAQAGPEGDMARGQRRRMGRRLSPGALMIGVLLLALSGTACSNLDRLLEEAEQGDADDRRDRLSELELEVRRLRGEEPDVQKARAKIDAFLRNRFTIERDAINRAQILALALQGEYPCASDLVLEGARDPSLMVRQQAVQGLREAPSPEARAVLTDLLRNDRSLLVRIEAAKVFRSIGDEGWVEPLVAIVVDETEEESLRWQCHASANQLTGQELPFTAGAWARWKEQQDADPPGDPDGETLDP